MRRFTIIILTLSVALGFTACGERDSDDPPTTVTVTVPVPVPVPIEPEPEPEPELDLEAGYLESVRSFSPELYDVPDNLLVDMGEAICLAFDNGESVESVIITGLDSGVSDQSLAAVIGATVVWFCPEYENLVDSASI